MSKPLVFGICALAILHVLNHYLIVIAILVVTQVRLFGPSSVDHES